MKIEMFFLLVVLSVLIGKSDQEKTAIDKLYDCMGIHGILVCFTDNTDQRKPTWRTLPTLTRVIARAANKYIAKEADAEFVKDEVVKHTCGIIEKNERPMIRIGGFDECVKKIKDECGTIFIENLDKESHLYVLPAGYAVPRDYGLFNGLPLHY